MSFLERLEDLEYNAIQELRNAVVEHGRRIDLETPIVVKLTEYYPESFRVGTLFVDSQHDVILLSWDIDDETKQEYLEEKHAFDSYDAVVVGGAYALDSYDLLEMIDRVLLL